MDWLGDFLAFCFHHGIGGIVLLVIAGWAVLMLLLGVLYAVTRVIHGSAALGQAFADGWRGHSRN